MFPGGLVYPFGNLAERVVNLVGLSFKTNLSYLGSVFLVAAYGLYGFHLNLTWKVATRRTFLVLMFALMIIVTGNIAGCSAMWAEHNEHKMERLESMGATL